MTKLPERPWAEVAIDLHGPFQSGKYLLVIIDEQSRFPVVEVVRSTSAEQILPRLRKTFALFGHQTWLSPTMAHLSTARTWHLLLQN